MVISKTKVEVDSTYLIQNEFNFLQWLLSDNRLNNELITELNDETVSKVLEDVKPVMDGCVKRGSRWNDGSKEENFTFRRFTDEELSELIKTHETLTHSVHISGESERIHYHSDIIELKNNQVSKIQEHLSMGFTLSELDSDDYVDKDDVDDIDMEVSDYRDWGIEDIQTIVRVNLPKPIVFADPKDTTPKT